MKTPGQDVVHTLDNPINEHGGLIILKGNIAPDGGVIKLFGYARHYHKGPARVFDSENEALEAGYATRSTQAMSSSSGTRGRRADPYAGVSAIAAGLIGQGLGGECALVTDGPLQRRDRGAHVRSRRSQSGGRRADRSHPRGRYRGG